MRRPARHARRASRGLGILLLVGIALAHAPRGAAQEASEPLRGIPTSLHLLSFNRWGELANPAELELVVRVLREEPSVQRIFVLSYGWAKDAEASWPEYQEMLEGLGGELTTGSTPPNSVAIAIGWDSSQTGFRKLFNDLLPFPLLADGLAYLPDRMLFPVSFWSKAAQADRIGFGGLRAALNQIIERAYEDPETVPEIHLIGHSFGCRVLSALMQQELIVPVSAEPFRAGDRVRSALLLQPALSVGNLHRGAHYPIAVTQSQHDHANGILFPIANIPVNSFAFTSFEGLFRHGLLDPIHRGLETVTDVVTTGTGTPDPETSPPQPGAGTARRYLYVLRRSLAELLAIPATLAFSAVTVPLSYGAGQVEALATRPVEHLMDSLAQLPLVEAPVYLLDRALGREVPWGQRSKGVFSLGGALESVGRGSRWGLFVGEALSVHAPGEVVDRSRGTCALPTCAGPFAVDVSDIVRESAFGLDLGRPLVDFTLGWLDPVGAHGEYLPPRIRLLSRQLLEESTPR